MKGIFGVSILLLMPGLLFSMAGKIEKVPLGPASPLTIRDGECLHYESFSGGEKTLDAYFVTRLTNSASGTPEALLYEGGVRADGNNKLPDHYTNYNCFFRIDLKKASLIESIGHFTTNHPDNAPSGYRGLFYWHYRLDEAACVIDYESRHWDGYEVKTKMNRLKADPLFPHWDSMSGAFFAVRYLDLSKPGIMCFVIPEILKDPLAITFRVMGKETVTTRAGTFKTFKIGMIAADPFLAKLMDGYAKSMFYWVEESDRHLLVKLQTPVSVMILQDISNVIRN